MMITLQDTVNALKNLAEFAEAGNLGQVSSKGQDLLDAIDQAIRPMYPIYKTGSRSAPRPVYGWDYESYAAARPHLLDAITHAKAGNKAAVLKSIISAKESLQPSKP